MTTARQKAILRGRRPEGSRPPKPGAVNQLFDFGNNVIVKPLADPKHPGWMVPVENVKASDPLSYLDGASEEDLDAVGRRIIRS